MRGLLKRDQEPEIKHSLYQDVGTINFQTLINVDGRSTFVSTPALLKILWRSSGK